MKNLKLASYHPQTNSNYPVLRVENLTVYQGNYLVLKDISFELMSGTNTAIIGPNGGGKSTLVGAVLGLVSRRLGRVEILNRPVEHLGLLSNQIGYVPQHFLFDRSFPLSVQELVSLGWVNSHNYQFSWANFWQQQAAKKTAVKIALQRVDAYHLRSQAIGTLSGGQLKRVLLAYCLVMPRKLLVLDEALAGVDVQGEAEFYGLLNELKSEQNWTILQVSHDLTRVRRHCDQVICLNQKIICTGTPETALSPHNLLATYGPAFQCYDLQ